MKTRQRESGIETLKILAMILIVISHATQTLEKIASLNTFPDLCFSTLTIFRLFGPLGNAVFFICSAWFMLESDTVNKKKWFSILIEVWFVSVFILAITLILRQGQISRDLIVKSLFPTISNNNWYLTCYLLFYPIHPLLNNLIKKLTSKELFRIVVSLFLLYFGIAFVFSEKLYCSNLIIWITIYFIVAYMRKHPPTVKCNTLLFLLGLLGLIVLPFFCAFIGNHIPVLSNKIGHLIKNNNPFLLFLALSLFNFAKNIHFKNSLINFISSLSLLIYIIHENLILRRVFRIEYTKYMLDTFGQNTIILQVLIFSAVIFIFALICAWMYCKSIRKLVFKISDLLYHTIAKYYLAFENRFHS